MGMKIGLVLWVLQITLQCTLDKCFLNRWRDVVLQEYETCEVIITKPSLRGIS
jgi:hypothetical protein